MATKDITDAQVVRACVEFHSRIVSTKRNDQRFVTEILHESTGEPIKVCERAIERAMNRKLIDCGVSLRTAWPTEIGKEFLEMEQK